MSEPLKYLLLIFATIFLAAGVYIFQPISAGVEAFSKTPPCSQPLRYTIGSIDPRFSITKPELEEAVETAVNVWNSGSETVLLAKREGDALQGDIIVQLVYDERQERTDLEIRFRERIRSQQIRLDRQQLQHEAKRESFDRQSSEYKEFAGRTSERLEDLNKWVTEKNENGGFIGADLEEFTRRKNDVEEAQESVLQKQQELDRLARSINNEMDELNEKFDAHNKLIDQYNDEFAGDLRFAKATYQKTSDGGVVTVNQFINEKELVLILAHELGHALGISHLRQPESIMYSQMGKQQLNPSIQLTQSDMQAAEQLCY
ncbi:MAG TPA: matrixin family metalloprotease [Balneolaceae bacterium]|nr:matrixin family metalloprotease [Balneolaceae bacterium]